MIAQSGESSTSSNVYAACDNILLYYEAEARFLAQIETVLYLSTLKRAHENISFDFPDKRRKRRQISTGP